MLKLTRHDPPYDNKHIWMAAALIANEAVLEQGDGCTVIWVGGKSHLVTETAETILNAIGPNPNALRP